MVLKANLSSLPFGPREGFILSRIDGVKSLAQIADSVGASEGEVRAVLDQLAKHGALEWTETEPRRDSKQPAAANSNSKRPARRATPLPDAPMALYDPLELEEDVDLDLERRKLVLGTYYRLDTLTHYELLGVPLRAERAAIRSSYFERSKIFHPDTMFRRRLGAFKPKMEAIFKRLTEAYEVLSNKDARAEYDSYLIQENKVGVPEASTSATSHRAVTPKPMDAETRRRAREAAARRLAEVTGRTLDSSPPSPVEVVQPPPAMTKDMVIRGLTSTLKQARQATGIPTDPIENVLTKARKAEELGDLNTANQHLRQALQMAPERSSIRAEYDRVRITLAKSNVDVYRKQAEVDENNKKWSSAALSWARVCDGDPNDPEAHRRAANCLLEAGGNLQQARKLAQQAVTLRGEDARNRILLGRVCLAAGLRSNAKRELELAAKLDPKNEMVKNLLKDLKDV